MPLHIVCLVLKIKKFKEIVDLNTNSSFFFFLNILLVSFGYHNNIKFSKFYKWDKNIMHFNIPIWIIISKHIGR